MRWVGAALLATMQSPLCAACALFACRPARLPACLLAGVQMFEDYSAVLAGSTEDAAKWASAKAGLVAEVDKVTQAAVGRVLAATTAAKKKDGGVLKSLQQVLQTSLRNL